MNMMNKLTPTEFCYWLQGFSELTDAGQSLSKNQWEIIRQHLALVFDKITDNIKPQECIPAKTPLQIDWKKMMEEFNKDTYPQNIPPYNPYPNIWPSGPYPYINDKIPNPNIITC